MRYFKLFALLALLALAVSFGPDVARAEGPDGDSGANTNLGSTDPGLIPGVNGYKVFGPDAIKQVPAQRLGLAGASPMTETRTGATDEYGCGSTACGSHTSESELFESQIHVDGAAKWSWASGWLDSCPNHTTGHLAQCSTQLQEDFCRVWTAMGHSWHYFHTSGYLDSDFQTSDTWQC